MNLLELVRRTPVPIPWAEGDKIPWNDPAFSRRMLAEHLSQAHDAASRRVEIIDRHVDWMHTHILDGRPGRVLDLGCGPGLYTSRLARLGHTCLGIDWSPASIAHARQQAEADGLSCRYLEQDIRVAEYGTGYELTMLLFGEFNVFRPAEAKAIVRRAIGALAPGGWLLLEPHTFAAVRDLGLQSPTWYSSTAGLFADGPHLCLMENAWDDQAAVCTERYFIVDVASSEVTRHASSMQAYTDVQYRELLAACGGEDVTFYPSLGGVPAAGLLAITARRALGSGALSPGEGA